MERRFTFKDLIIIVLLAGVLVSTWLAMRQYDRQWGTLQKVEREVAQLTTEQSKISRSVAELRREISSGVAIVPANPNPGPGNAPRTLDDPFRRIRQVQQLPDYATGDWLVEAFSQVVPKLNPLTSQDIYGSIVQAKVVESLVMRPYDTLDPTPMLAESWQIAEDGLSATFQLRRNVVFSDGEPMDADDVVFTYRLIMNPDVTDERQRVYYRIITDVEKLGPHEVRFHFERKFYESFDRASGIGILPEHLYRDLAPEQIRNNPGLLMGTGPYRLPDPINWRPGQQIELVRNTRYWGEPGPWDRIIYRTIEKDSTQLVAFRNGELDAFGATPEQHVEMKQDEQLLAEKQLFELETLRRGYIYVMWNQKRGDEPTVFADKRVRQAMTMLIDRKRLIDELYLGYGTVATGPFHHLGPQVDASLPPWPHDTERAITLLIEAGFTRNDDDVLRRADGEPFTIKFTYPAGSDMYQRLALALRDNFARAGIQVDLDPQKWALLMKSLNERTFDAISLGWSSGLEVDIEQMFHTRAIAGLGDNRMSYASPELDALIDQAHVTLDRDERMKLWQACHRVLYEDQPYTFLARGKILLWVHKRYQNIQPMPKIGLNQVSIWSNPIEWYVPAELQPADRQ